MFNNKKHEIQEVSLLWSNKLCMCALIALFFVVATGCSQFNLFNLQATLVVVEKALPPPSVQMPEPGVNSPTTPTTPHPDYQIFAHEMGSCLLKEEALSCWGENAYYQQTNGTTTDVLLSTPLPGFASGVSQVTGGFDFTCAVVNGGVKCWGLNTYGQLGDGTTTASMVPVAGIGLDSGVKKIVTGNTHACALLVDGGVKCWGRNLSGRLGRGIPHSALSYDATPDYVIGLTSGVEDISRDSARSEHTCAILTGGELRCWGNNANGQLGIGSTSPTSSSNPVNVTGLSGEVVTRVETSRYATCALLASGVVKCWGDNDFGQLGDNRVSGNRSTSPVDVLQTNLSMGETVIDISLGEDQACLLTDAGGVYCWGRNNYGQGGTGVMNTYNSVPLAALLPKPAKQLATGRFHSCILTSDDEVYCWGYNRYGQLGQGDIVDSSSPLLVVIL